MPEHSELPAVLRRFGFDVGERTTFQPVGGGFSGAEIWRVETPAGSCCLRRWPEEGPVAERIHWIHTLLRHAYAAGCKFVPLPLRSDESGSTLVTQAGRQWELTNWMNGRTDDGPTLADARLNAVLRAIAKFHGALADEPWAAVVDEASPGIAERLARIDDGLSTGLRDLRAAVVPFAWAELNLRRDEYVGLFAAAAAIVRPRLVEAMRRRRCLQPCIRDIRRAHL